MTQPHYIDRSSAVADLRHCIAVASQSQPGWREVWQDALKSLTEAPMEAVAWRLENLILPGVTFTEDRRYAEALRDDRYEGRVTTIVQALAVIPTEGAQTIAADKMAHILRGMIARGTAIDDDAVDRALTLATYWQDPTDDDRAWAAEAATTIPTQAVEQSSGNTGELNTEGKTNDRP